MSLVALPSHIFDAHGSTDQDNPLCAKIITLKHNGVTRQAVISDENTSSEQSIDMCLDLWQALVVTMAMVLSFRTSLGLLPHKYIRADNDLKRRLVDYVNILKIV